MIALHALVLYVVYAYITWLLFLAIMSIKAAKDAGRLTAGGRMFAIPVLAVGIAADVFLNVTATVPFVELPKEWLFTHRVSRHLNDANWRGTMSRWLCRNLLDPFEVGGHCTSKNADSA